MPKPTPTQSFEKLTVKVESQALQELQKISDKIDKRLSQFEPDKEIKDGLTKELKNLASLIEKFQSQVSDIVDNLKEIVGIEQYIM